MIQMRRAADRGQADFGWLKSAHTFSFGQYMDPRFRGFRDLLVINDDRVAPGRGFGTHGHSDMEIISYVLDGEIEHRDSLGNGEVLRVGELQRMSAGTGIRHSEFNPSKDKGLHFLQMWVLPERAGLKPSYEQKSFPVEERRGRWQTLVSPDGAEGSLLIHQDVRLLGTLLLEGDVVDYEVPAARYAWLHVATGEVTVNGVTYQAGDGAAVAAPETLRLQGVARSEVILFDLR
jgi:redox-sensitive bicupin YhaK (pirin superfamily)